MADQADAPVGGQRVERAAQRRLGRGIIDDDDPVRRADRGQHAVEAGQHRRGVAIHRDDDVHLPAPARGTPPAALAGGDVGRHRRRRKRRHARRPVRQVAGQRGCRRRRARLLRRRVERAAEQVAPSRPSTCSGRRRAARAPPAIAKPRGRASGTACCTEADRSVAVIRSAPRAAIAADQQDRIGVRIAGVPGPSAQAAVMRLDEAGNTADRGEPDRAAEQVLPAHCDREFRGARPGARQGGAGASLAVQPDLGLAGHRQPDHKPAVAGDAAPTGGAGAAGDRVGQRARR